MKWLGLSQDTEIRLFIFHLSSMSNDKEGAKDIWAALTQNSRNCHTIPQ
jgi:hypothetical protein